MDNDYIAKRMAALGLDGSAASAQGTDAVNDMQRRYEALQAEYARLKAQVEKAPPATFKSETQTAFEQSAECEQILTVFFNRFMRDKYMAEFQASPHLAGFQEAANIAFTEFEKNYKTEKKEATKSGQNCEKGSGGTNKTAARKDA